MNRTLTFQTFYNYPLHLHFQSPIGDIFSYGEEVSKEIYDTWISGYKDGTYSSWTSIICRKIAETIVNDMPNMWIEYNYYDVILSILCGEMYHTYYTSGPYGEKLFDYMDEVLDCISKKKNGEDILFQADDAWMKAITEFLIPIKGSHLDWSDNEDLVEKFINGYKSAVKTNYVVSPRGIQYAKIKGYDESIIKGLKEIYVRRGHNSDFRILEAIIAYVYFEKELILYFHPRFFELGICDKNNFQFTNSGTYMVIDFGRLISKLFCDDCIRKLRENSKIKDIKFNKSATEEEKKQQVDAISKMFSNLRKIIDEEHFDDIALTLRGEYNDPNKFHELEQNTKFGDVGFKKHKEKKVGAWAEVTETLKDTRKSLKKK